MSAEYLLNHDQSERLRKRPLHTSWVFSPIYLVGCFWGLGQLIFFDSPLGGLIFLIAIAFFLLRPLVLRAWITGDVSAISRSLTDDLVQSQEFYEQIHKTLSKAPWSKHSTRLSEMDDFVGKHNIHTRVFGNSSIGMYCLYFAKDLAAIKVEWIPD